jgi:HAD domain in Swiss Army Knife RNA repair proteins
MDQRIILFLDIDGVLLPFPNNASFNVPPGGIFPKEKLAALTHILEAFPVTTAESPESNMGYNSRINIVLSSTWRVQKSIRDEIISDFQAYGRGPLGAFNDFYDITDPKLHTERQHEIYEWLRRRLGEQKNGVLAWIALDDEELLQGVVNAKHKSYFDGHVIHCDSTVGLTHNQAIEAVHLLQAQLGAKGCC